MEVACNRGKKTQYVTSRYLSLPLDLILATSATTRSEQNGGEPKSFLLAGNRGLAMRVMTIYCPERMSAATVRRTNRKHPKLSDVYCYCSNVECGHTFVMNVSFSHTINPSALRGQGRIKELMDAMPPDERQKALELLLAAKESH